MQEEIEQKSATLMINGTKFSLRTLKSAALRLLAHRQNPSAPGVKHRGKQTVRQLVGQNQGVSNIELSGQDLKEFQRIPRRYGVDYESAKWTATSRAFWCSSKPAIRTLYTVHLLCPCEAVSERFEDEQKAQALADACNGQIAEIIRVEKKTRSDHPPKLYDLTTLQREANQLFGYTAQQTLDCAQSLYEKKLAT